MSPMMQVLDILRDANVRRDKAAILAVVTPDVEYHYHVGSPPLVGAAKLGKFLDRYWAMSADPEWVIINHAESGDRLLVEGYEEYRDVATGRQVMNRYMGILEFRDGRIARWRDYFQMQPTPVQETA